MDGNTLGYIRSDLVKNEDVRGIIEDFLGCLSDEQLVDIRKHFIFISYKKDEKELIEIERTIVTKNGVEIPFVEIQTDNYAKVYEKLGQLTPGISPIRVRGTLPLDMVKKKCGAVVIQRTLRTLTAAGRKAPGRAQNLTCQVAFLMSVAVKSAFALLSTKVTKPVPVGTKYDR